MLSNLQKEQNMNNSSVVPAGASPAVFNNPEFGSVRVIVRKDNGEPLFCLKDIAICLGYADPTRAVKDICDPQGVCILPAPSEGGIQQVKFGYESEVYRLIFGSKLESAKKFQDWVFKIVLPSIRKTGSYSVQKTPQTYVEALKETLRLAEENEKLISMNKAQSAKIDAQSAKIAEDKPKVAAYDVFMGVSDDLITIGDFAKILHTKWSDIKPHRLFDILREAKILKDSFFDKNIPYQKYIDRGYFKVKETTSTNSLGYSFISRQTLITPKGQKYLLDKFMTARESDPEEQMVLFEGDE